LRYASALQTYWGSDPIDTLAQQDFFRCNPNGCILSTTGKAKKTIPGYFNWEGASMSSKLSGRRRFLRDSAALVGLAAGVVPSAGAQMSPSEVPPKDSKDLIAYGERSHYVKSVRIPVMERMSPDDFGMTFHVLSPLQDSVGIITASSLHYVATHRGSYVPDINPQEHRLMIHGMVDRPLIFTVEELKRLPYVTRTHFLECSGNRAKATHKTVQQTHGMTSCCEWTGVPLSLLLKEAGVQSGASFIVTEGAETVKGATSIPLAKAMDDCLVCYGQNGEAVRPQHGFPLRLIVPGYEGIYNTKYLRRIKVVEQHYMTYNDYGHIAADARVAALNRQVGPKSIITFPSGEQTLPGPGFYEITGLAWSGSGAIRSVDISIDGGQTWTPAELRSPAYPMAHTRFGFHWTWDGKECVIMSRSTDELGTVQPTRADIAKYWNQPNDSDLQIRGLDNSVFPWRVASDGSVHNGLA
jgi:sulfane dehydrogenase subunit SoxC